MKFEWVKVGKIFDPTKVVDKPWLKEFAQAPSTLIFDDFVRVYFSCRPPADDKGQYVSYTAFVDLKRDDLTSVVNVSASPILPLGGRGTFDEFGVYPTSVIRTDEKIMAFFGGWTRCESVPFNVAIGCAQSFDGGVTFERLGNGPILSYSPNEPFILSGPKIRRFNGRWQLFYIAGKKWIQTSFRPEPVYRIRMATSDNGLDWVKHDQDLIPTRIEDDECQASPDVFFHGGSYHMFFCYRYSLNYKSKEGGYRIGYAYSKDLISWIRRDDLAGIDVSTTGWDSEMVSYPHVFILDGQIWMMYLGNDVGRYGFGLARLSGNLPSW
ncbi:MAG: glycosylase [Bacteroidetes bacterium]|nr:glycosylase [Bacteroidota bacterium]